MGDIWSNVGASLPSTSQDWLYQLDGQIHGPVPKEKIVQKLLAGDLDAKTLIAREGGEFHSLSQVAAFAPHLEELGDKLDEAASKSKRNAIIVVILVLLGAGGGLGFYLKTAADAKGEQLVAEHAAAQAKLDEEAKQRKALLDNDNVELVALVSFDESAMKVGGTAPVRTRRPKGPKGTGPKGGRDVEPPMMSSCQRSTGEILNVLKKHLRNINTCVQAEKSRDPGNLPATLKLSFVAKPDGKVGDFNILDRHYKTGPMRNCMIKTFRMVKYPPTGGSNCPVTIPIKIGG